MTLTERLQQRFTGFTPTTPSAPAPINGIQNAIPGFNNLSSSASTNIGQQLSGLPSASPTRTANAYFGVQSGMPGSDFIRNRGYDLYRQQANQYQQQGLDNFLKLIQGYSGTVAPSAGQQIDMDKYNRSLEFDRDQVSYDRAMETPQPIGTVPGQYHAGMGSIRKSEAQRFRIPKTGRTFSMTRRY